VKNFVKRALAVAGVALSVVAGRPARGSDGGGSPGDPAVRPLTQEILFVDNPGPTMTAIMQAEVAPGSGPFVWLVPTRTRPRVERSSSTVFQRLAGATAPEYLLEVNTSGACKADGSEEPQPGAPGASATSSSAALDYDFVDPGGQGTVAQWLTTNGYAATESGLRAIEQYAKEGFGWLAVRVNPAPGAERVRPIALTYEAERPVIPIRAARGAAAGELGLRVWVIGPAQAVPINVPSLVLNEARIDWTSGVIHRALTLPANGAGLPGPQVREPANYGSVVAAAAADAGGQGFVSELAAPASQFRQMVWSHQDADQIAELSKRRYRDGVEAIAAAREAFGEWDGFLDAIRGATTLPDGVTADAFEKAPEKYRGQVQVDAARFLRLVRELVIRPVAEAGAQLAQAPCLTRLYTRLRLESNTVAPAFDYNRDLAQIAKARRARQWIRCDPTLSLRDAPWRIRLPRGGAIAGKGSALPVGVESMPANLMVVTLSTSGSGSVVRDNRDAIGRQLVGAEGASDAELDMPRPPQLGLLIGGSQRVTPSEPAPAPLTAAVKPATRQRCSIGAVGVRGGGSAAPLLVAGILLVLRRRSSRAAALCLLVVACESGAGKKAEPNDAPAASVAAGAKPAALPDTLPVERLKNPETCKPCHPMQYREWSGSMHAYASMDPVFVAMNARGQRETRGLLGDFCFKCHAPMAVRDGLVKNGTDPRQLPEGDRGITCYFCHNVTAIEGNHNGMLRIAGDTTMRGPIRDPAPTRAHLAAFSSVFDESAPQISEMCGGCHDIVMPSGVHLERTFEEYRHGIFSKTATGAPPVFSSCVSCHMPGEQGYAATAKGKGITERVVHKHLWPGVDVALTDFPNRDVMRSAVERCELPASVSFFTLEVTPPDLFTFQIETNAGHNQPSGAAQDRRMWLEVSAYDDAGRLLDDVSSGLIADGELEEKPEGDPKHDPNLLLFADRIFDEKGEPAHMFWQAAKSASHPEGYESNLLPAATTTYLEGRHAVLKQYRIAGPKGLPARVTARLRLRPIGLDVLQDLVRTGDLDASFLAQMPTFTLGAQIEWTKEKGLMKPVHATLTRANCHEFRCLLEPGSKYCKAPPPAKPSDSAKEPSLDSYRY
jgi:hypothetical protein